MYRNYINIQLPPIAVKISENIYDNEKFMIGENLDIIDIFILKYTYNLPVVIQNKNNLDGPCDLEYIFNSGKMYFELNYSEFQSIYMCVKPLTSENDFKTRIKKLNEFGLLENITSQHDIELYTTTDLYENLFID